MRALVVEDYDRAPALREVARPDPAAGEVLLAVEAAASTLPIS